MSNEPGKLSSMGLVWLGVSLALGLVVSTVILSNTMKTIKFANQSITVKGYAEKQITSDLASWTLEFSTEGKDMVGCYNSIERDFVSVAQFLTSKGISRSEMSISPIYTEKQFQMTPNGMVTNIIDGYRLLRRITVTSSQVKLIDEVSSDITSLIKQGIAIVSQPPQYTYTKINDLKIEMLGEATKDARARADQLATNSGSKVGVLKTANQGVFQITPPNSGDVSDLGMSDMTSIDKVMKAVVTIDFTIK